ncbi:MAG: hydrogen gas-evolving membrane-bound hydrogenase subunit E [Christensenellales bacterium]
MLQFPLFGSPDNPAVNEVVERYVEKGLEETGAVNMVAGMILDYRAFDTFGESSVLFLAVTCTMLLMRDRNNTTKEEDLLTAREHVIEGHEEDIILTKIARLVIPCALVYGIYVVLNGHLSPGGGFSGGTIMGSALILFAVSFGMIRISRFFIYATFRKVTSCALMVYAASSLFLFHRCKTIWNPYSVGNTRCYFKLRPDFGFGYLRRHCGSLHDVAFMRCSQGEL